MIKTYRFALDPTPEQEEMFNSHAGGARQCYNWAIDYARNKYLSGEKFSPTQISLQNEMVNSGTVTPQISTQMDVSNNVQ